MAMINLKLDDELRRLFKAACVEREISMQQQLIYLITKDLQSYNRQKQVK